MRVERRRQAAARDNVIETRAAPRERQGFRVDLQDHARAAACLGPRHHPQELEGIAKALLIVDQQGLAGDGLAAPARALHLAFDGCRVRETVAVAVFTPAALELAQQQQRFGQIEACRKVARRVRHQHLLDGPRFRDASLRAERRRQQFP